MSPFTQLAEQFTDSLASFDRTSLKSDHLSPNYTSFLNLNLLNPSSWSSSSTSSSSGGSSSSGSSSSSSSSLTNPIDSNTLSNQLIPIDQIPLKQAGIFDWFSSLFTSEEQNANEIYRMECAKKMQVLKDKVAVDFENAGAIQLVHQAQKRSIHAAWLHANKAASQAREAADAALQVVEEVARTQRFLDPDGDQIKGGMNLVKNDTKLSNAIHEGWVHARRAQDAAREAGEFAVASADEALRVQKYLDPHDVIRVQTITEGAVTKAEAAENSLNSI